MAVLAAGILWASVVAWLLLRAVAQSRAHRPPPQDGAAAHHPLPAVSVIVPMRNEIANVARCLDGLLRQTGLAAGSAIIVVDDESQDGTVDAVRHAMQRDARLQLVRPGPLPAGWMGKPHACWVGAKAAEAPWLCFVDADVRAAPDLLRTVLVAAEIEGIDMLSLAPFQLLGSFWERLIVPAGLMLIGCTLDLRRSGNPAGDLAVNGQVLLVRSAVYFAVGGHAAVRDEVCEDKALADRLRRGGGRYRFFDGAQLAETRMYTDLRSLWSGFAKNAVDIIGNAGDTLAVATAGLLVGWAALLIPTMAALAVHSAPGVASLAGFGLSLAGSLVMLAVHVASARHFRIPLAYGMLFPLAYTVVAALAVHSVVARRAGRIRWKGRVYELPRATASRSR